MAAIPIPKHLRHVPFTLDQALAAGLTKRILQGRRFRLLLREVYVSTDVDMTLRLWIYAALLILPDHAVVSHLTALRWYGVSVGPERPLHFSTNRATQTRQREIAVHRRRGTLHPGDHNGVQVLGPDRTFVDCATLLGPISLIQAGDQLLHLGHTTLTELTAYCDRVHLDGVLRARQAVRLVCEKVESPMETLIRLMLICARLPKPACNAVVLDTLGEFVARCDLVYHAHRVIIEYDGKWHEQTPEQRRKDRLRIARLERVGWHVIVVRADDLADRRAVVERIHRQLVAGGYTGPAPHYNLMWIKWFS